MKNRAFAIVLSLLLILAALPMSVGAEEDASERWWEQDYWSLDVLTSLGAEPPVYNAAEARYEISTPEQLLYLTGLWKTDDQNSDGAPDAPCTGTYVLTADLDMAPLMDSIGEVLTEKRGEQTKGYMPPIAALVDETADGGVKCAFFGTFDGQFHAIKNLRIERPGYKYVGLFGNIGHDFGQGYVKNLAILDAEIKGVATCGILAGSIYGDVDNVVCTGTIDCAEKNAGGLAGKIKRNENGYYGIARNCFVYADILVRGEGNENGAAGGISASNSKGGQIVNCFVGGSITVLGTNADSVGGVVGNLKGGTAIDNNAMLLTRIDGGTKSENIGLLCGSYSGDSGSHLHNNYVWEGTALLGGVSSVHPADAAFKTASAAELESEALYRDTLGWDFETVWEWVGDEAHGYPMIRGFAEQTSLLERLDNDLTVKKAVLRLAEPMKNTAYDGDPAEITATVLIPKGDALEGGKLYYGTAKDRAKLTDYVRLTAKDGMLTASFPKADVGSYYYYITAETEDSTLSFPTEGTMRLDIFSAASRCTPTQLTLSPGATVSDVCINWITEMDGLTAELRCRKVGAASWENKLPVTEIERVQVLGDHGTFTSYSADLHDLEPATDYEYMAVTSDGSKEYASSIYSFQTLPAGNAFSFVVISDLQSTNEEGYLPYLYTDQTYLTDTLHPDFIANVGDLTEDDTMAQWKYMYDTIGGIYATKLTAFAPGNHEGKGDVIFSHFKGRTNLPDSMTDPILKEVTSSFIVGDVCFVTLNTNDVTSGEKADASGEKMEYYRMQKDWAQQVFEASGCKWRVLLIHAGLVQKDPEATAFLETMCEDLHVDLVFNGHIHNYFRATVDGSGNHAEPGNATTFVTISPMGPKFDDYGGEIDDILDIKAAGNSRDERQYFAYVETSDSSITVTVYQRTKAGDASKSICSDYTAIDTFTLNK